MRPNIWHVPVKTAEQQAVMTLRRVRQGLVKERTSMINQLRGLLSEFGIIIPKGRYSLHDVIGCLLYTSPSPRDRQKSRMPSSA